MGETTVFTGGAIRTMDAARPTASALVVDGDRIAAVGEPGVATRFPGARRIDLAGRTVVPGFIDAHTHLCLEALHPRWADARHVTDAAGLAARLQAQAEAEPHTDWVRAVGWSDLDGGFTPTRADLDAAGIDRPVIVVHYSYHQAVVSSAGLDRLGIGRSTADPEGGMVARDRDGRPTGLLVERAFSEAHRQSMEAYRDPDRWADLIVEAGRRLWRDGVTAVHDAACPPSAEAVYGALARSGRLPVGVVMMPHGEALLGPLDATRLDGPVTGEGDEWLRVGPVKLFADGGTQPGLSGSVAGRHFSTGIVFDGLASEVDLVVERGFRVAVHAIGNRGVGAALDAFAGAARSRPDDEHRFRVEHATLVGTGQVARMAALGVVGVVQPGFLHHMGGAVDGFELEDATWMAFADLAAAGVPVAASSDSPCAFSAPLLTSARGTTRLTSKGTVLGPEQSLPYDRWLHAYTVGAAFAGGQEGERGRLAPGLRADLVLLAGPLDAEQPPSVSETWIGGRRVHGPPSSI